MRQPNEETEERCWQHIAARRRGSPLPDGSAANENTTEEWTELTALAEALHATLNENSEPVSGEKTARARLTALIEAPAPPNLHTARPQSPYTGKSKGKSAADPSRRPLLILLVLLLVLLACLAIGYQQQRANCAAPAGSGASPSSSR